MKYASTFVCALLAAGLVSCQSAAHVQQGQGTPNPQSAGPTGAAQLGLYTSVQADRGEASFQQNCAGCHGTGEFSGSAFMNTWVGQPVFQLYAQIASTMPYDAPGTLSREVYTDILAYMLSLNDLTAGDKELPSDPSGQRAILIQ